MGLFGLFRNKNSDNNSYNDEVDDELEFLEDFMYDDSEEKSHKPNTKKNRYASTRFDSEEEAKLDAQLNENITDIQLKEQYEKAIEQSKFKKLDYINLNRFSKSDIEKYINSQCDILNETSKYIDEAKEEYSVVTSYFSDIQLIETAPENIRKKISNYAEAIAGLTVDRKIFHTTDNKLSNNVFSRMERIEQDMPGVLIQLQNHESHFQTIKKDLKMLEGERASIRYDAKDLVKRQFQIRKSSMMSIIGLFLVFAIFVVSSLVIESESDFIFLAVIGLSALLAVGLFSYLKTTERRVIVTEIKLNKATNLLNKAKIKYINSANTLDYEYSKYGVKSSYQLTSQYELYLKAKQEKKKISRLTDDLNDAEVKLELILKGLRLYDPHIWLAQVKALIDTKEMVEVRHDLAMQRQKLRMQIEYNMNRVDEIKQDIKRITISNPEYTAEVLRLIENYESKK